MSGRTDPQMKIRCQFVFGSASMSIVISDLTWERWLFIRDQRTVPVGLPVFADVTGATIDRNYSRH